MVGKKRVKLSKDPGIYELGLYLSFFSDLRSEDGTIIEKIDVRTSLIQSESRQGVSCDTISSFSFGVMHGTS